MNNHKSQSEIGKYFGYFFLMVLAWLLIFLLVVSLDLFMGIFVLTFGGIIQIVAYVWLLALRSRLRLYGHKSPWAAAFLSIIAPQLFFFILAFLTQRPYDSDFKILCTFGALFWIFSSLAYVICYKNYFYREKMPRKTDNGRNSLKLIRNRWIFGGEKRKTIRIKTLLYLSIVSCLTLLVLVSFFCWILLSLFECGFESYCKSRLWIDVLSVTSVIASSLAICIIFHRIALGKNRTKRGVMICLMFGIICFSIIGLMALCILFRNFMMMASVNILLNWNSLLFILFLVAVLCFCVFQILRLIKTLKRIKRIDF